jgi:hypothetical protein
MHIIKQRQPQYAGRKTLFIEIAGQVQGLPPLLEAEPGQWLAVLTNAEAYQVRLWRELRDVEQELKGK